MQRSRCFRVQFLLLLLLLPTAGCGYCRDSPHPWFAAPPLQRRFVPLSITHYAIVPHFNREAYNEALQRLGAQAAIPLRLEELSRYLPSTTHPADPVLGNSPDFGLARAEQYPGSGVRPYLVRGVVRHLLGGCEAWTEIDGTAVWVFQYRNDTFGGRVFCERQDPSPMVVVLTAPPSTVFATYADAPGDYPRIHPHGR